MYQHGAGYYLLNGRWHKLHKDKPAPKGAPVAAHPKAGGDHQAVAHFTQEQWDALKLPDTNTNAPSYNKALANLQQLSDAGDVTGMLAISYGLNTYGQKLAKIANHLLGLHGSQHKVAPGQKAGTHAALQSAPAEPHPTGLPEHLAPKTTPDLQEPGPLAPLAQHVKDTLDTKAADGDVEFIKMVAANNPEHPQIVAYAQQKLAGMQAKAPAPAPVEPPAPPAPAGPLSMPAFEEGKTASGVVDHYKKVAQKVIDHGHAGNAVVLEDMKAEGLKPNSKGKVSNTWAGKTANSKKLLALHAQALAHATGGAPAADHSAHDTSASKVLHVIPSSDSNAGYEVHVATPKSAPGSKFSVVVKDIDSGEFLPSVKTFPTEAAALHHAHAIADAKDPSAPASAPFAAPDALPPGWSGLPNSVITKPGDTGGIVDKNAAGLGWFVIAHNDAAHAVLGGKNFESQAAAVAALDHALAGGKNPSAGVPPHAKKAIDDLIAAGESAYALELYGPGSDAKQSIQDYVASKVGPKEGDTKPAADGGTLVLKDGHWVKQGVDAPAAQPPSTGALTAQQLSNLQSIPWFKLKLPPENTNAKSHNAALSKIEAMAFAGDTDGLQAFIDSKDGAKQTYAKKQVLTAQTALAGLGTPGATAAVPVMPQPAATPAADAEKIGAAEPKPGAYYQKKSAPLGGLGNEGPVHHVANADLGKIENLLGLPAGALSGDGYSTTYTIEGPGGAMFSVYKNHSGGLSVRTSGPNKNDATAAALAFFLEKNAPVAAAAPAAVAATPINATKTVTAPKTILHNTTQGHSKSWSYYVAPNASGGYDMVTEYGKIGANQQKTVKTFPSAVAAHKAATDLKQEKFTKGYVTHGVEYGHQVPVGAAAAADTGPKEGDTKQGADGMLVLKDGHWVKMGQPTPTGPTYGALKPAHAISLGTTFKTASSNKTKLKNWAVSGNAEAIQTFIKDAGNKMPVSKAYGNALLQAMAAASASGAAPASKPAAATPASVTTPGAHPSMDAWVQTGPQAGSNPGGRFQDADGVEWYCKFPPDEGHARSEVLAAKLYEAAGLKSQDAKLVTKGGKLGIASRWVGVKKVGAEGLQSTPGALGGFVVDAWLANWDVVGMGYDNLQVGSDGRAVRVDAGGSLQYRAQGAAKPFGHKVEEIKTMRDPKTNPQAAAVFGTLTAADMTASAKKVLSISDDQIHDLVMAHGPGDVAKKAELIDALIARKEDIAKQFPKAVPKEKVKPKPDPTKLKVSADQLPKPHDFQNWKGAGNGLSSKAHVNEANQAAEQALLDTALKGNLIALKDYHFDALDKETGAVVGKKPISEHPSNHVKTYWSDLVSTLSFIAYPPEALKKFKAIVATSITKVSDAFNAAKYGTTTKGVEANSRLAFWIALGSTKPAESLLPPGASLEFQSSPTGQPKVTTSMAEQAKAAYHALNAGRPVKRFINGIQSSGSYNDNFRDGRMVTTDGWDATAMALDAYGYATEKPEGFELYKWISFPGDMGKQMLSAPTGTVFQNPGSMCCSTGPTGTAGFGADRVRIRYAKGAKAVDSFGSGNHPGEKEITTLPGQRFVILKCHKVMCPVKNKERIELDVLMLPPDPTYVAELETMKGKHGGKS